jgi:hypothetical protein
MATTPQFSTTPKVGMLQNPTQSSARNTITPGAGDLVFTAGANGSRIDRVDVINADAEASAPPANVVRLWIYDGTNARLVHEVEMPANSPATTVKGYKETVTFINGLILPTGYTMRATRALGTSSYNVIAHGADY